MSEQPNSPRNFHRERLMRMREDMRNGRRPGMRPERMGPRGRFRSDEFFLVTKEVMLPLSEGDRKRYFDTNSKKNRAPLQRLDRLSKLPPLPEGNKFKVYVQEGLEVEGLDLPNIEVVREPLSVMLGEDQQP